MKDIWIIANWKSNKTISEALEWVDIVGPKLPKRDNLKVVVCPDFESLSEVKKAVMVGNYPLLVGAQDVSPFDIGSYTGEEPAKLLKELINVVIVGHSERRQNFGETDELVAEKTKKVLQNMLIPVVCVQDESIPVPEYVELVAYEPIFAIGTGTPDTPENADTVATEIKKRSGSNVTVLYGGSVTSENAKIFLQKENISGLLIGKASLDPEEFLKIVEVASNI